MLIAIFKKNQNSGIYEGASKQSATDPKKSPASGPHTQFCSCWNRWTELPGAVCIIVASHLTPPHLSKMYIYMYVVVFLTGIMDMTIEHSNRNHWHSEILEISVSFLNSFSKTQWDCV